MDLNHMMQFKAIADNNSVTKAAKLLFISQPALSKTLREFEQELGCDLFDRTKNSLILNHNGEIALQHVNNILSTVSVFQNNMAELSIKSKPLMIVSTAQIFLSYIVKKIISSKIHFNYSAKQKNQKQAEHMLYQGMTDIIFSYKPIDFNHNNYICKELCTEQLAVSVPKCSKLHAEDKIKFSDLESENFILNESTDTGELFTVIHQLLINKNININFHLDITDIIVREIKEHTNLLYFTTSFCEELTNQKYVNQENRKVHLINDTSAKFPIYITYPLKTSNSQQLLLDRIYASI